MGERNKESSTVSMDQKNPPSRSSIGLPVTDKDTKKTNVSSDRLEKAEQRLQISNRYQTLADLRDDMDYHEYLQTKTPPGNPNITPTLPPFD